MRMRPNRIAGVLWAAAGVVMLTCGAGAADSASKISAGDTGWVLACSALVMIMTPGLGLFYAGMVRRKNVLGHHSAELHSGRRDWGVVGPLRL